QFFNLNGFVRRLAEAVEQRITEFDGFGEPSYKLCRLNKTKALSESSFLTNWVTTLRLDL
ncbi:MAG: hypothetical protein KDB05_31985, partial [Planctomycetales bacterium]|nr:hypothetical protein [Planctomycetales bacterium]